MAVSMIYGIPQKLSFKWYIMCGLGVYNYMFFKKCGFYHGSERVKKVIFRGSENQFSM